MSFPLVILRLLAAVLSGWLLSLAYAPADIPQMIWVWPVPLLAALWWTPSKKGWKGLAGGFIYGWCAGLTFFLINLMWVRSVHDFGWITFSLYLAVYPGLWGVVCASLARPDEKFFKPGIKENEGLEDRVRKGLPPMEQNRFLRPFEGVGESLRSAFFAAAAWTGLEWLRGMVFTGFTWNTLGLALHDGGRLLLAQCADVIGQTGLSFPIMFVAVAGLNSVRRLILEIKAGRMRSRFDFASSLALLMVMFLYGLSRTSAFPDNGQVGQVLNTRLIQPNVPIALREDPAYGDKVRELLDVLSEGIPADTDLVLWPESSLPDWFVTPENQQLIEEVRKRGDFALMLGGDVFEPPAVPDGDPLTYNSAAFFAPGAKEAVIYRKSHLVPFGEYVPLRNIFEKIYPPIGDLVPGDFSRGAAKDPIHWEAKGVDLIPLICFEDTVGRYCRKFVRDRPQLLVNVTNDAWFQRSIESVQHLRNSIFRCIEFRRPMVRCANTGVSCVITARGSLARTADGPVMIRGENGNTFVTGTLQTSVVLPSAHPMTIYSMVGDAFSVALLLIVTGAFVPRLRRN